MRFKVTSSRGTSGSQLSLPEEPSPPEDLTQLRLDFQMRAPSAEETAAAVRWLRYFRSNGPLLPETLESLSRRVESLKSYLTHPPAWATRRTYLAHLEALRTWEPMLLAAKRSNSKSNG